MRGDLLAVRYGGAPCASAGGTWNGRGDDRKRFWPLRPVRSVSAAASRDAWAGSTTGVRVPASLTVPSYAAGIWYMSVVRLALPTGLRARGPGGVVR